VYDEFKNPASPICRIERSGISAEFWSPATLAAIEDPNPSGNSRERFRTHCRWKHQSCHASIHRDIASPRESDLRQVGLRRQICPQICFLWRASVARVRKGHSDANLSAIRRFALSRVKNDKSEKLGIKNKRLLAAWDTDYPAKVLFG